MHIEILKKEQIELLPLLKLFAKDYYLVGGTAFALHIGHRYSIDFDLFTNTDLKRKSIKNLLEKNNFIIQNVFFEDTIQLHILINNVKVTFYQFPYPIEATIKINNIIKMPDLLILAAMKAFALGGRGKWKDYVDLYYIFKNYFDFRQVSEKATQLFKDSFNCKLFRQQLCYFDDIKYDEAVDYIHTPIVEKEIKEFLTDIALQPF
jgi:hypothetical protein